MRENCCSQLCHITWWCDLLHHELHHACKTKNN